MKPYQASSISLLIFCFAALLCSSCKSSRDLIGPVNVGREYGNPKMPLMVSHLPEGNQWVMSRTGYHFFLRRIVCFDRQCRAMIGRRKALRAISFEDYRKRIRKNAKKGLYKKTTPVRPVKPDMLQLQKEPVKVATIETTLAAAPSVLKADSLITLSDLLFETDSHTLKGEHFASLDSLVKFLVARPSLEAIVSGHTDNTGSERHNVSLSSRRAEAVAEYLVDKGVSFSQVSFQGFGSSKPIAGNETEAGRRRNRRVEILLRNPK